MADPSPWASRAHFEYIDTDEDSGGVHTNSGIFNQALYDLVEG